MAPRCRKDQPRQAGRHGHKLASANGETKNPLAIQKIRIEERVLDECVLPTSQHPGLLSPEAGVVLGRIVAASRCLFVVQQLRMRGPNHPKPARPNPKAQVHIVPGNWEIIGIAAADRVVNLAPNGQARPGNRADFPDCGKTVGK